MRPLWQINFVGARPRSLLRLGSSGEVVRKAEPIWTVADFCRCARKSRRQVYRDIRAGRIRPLGKFLGEWLLEPSQLARLRPMPRSLPSLFPEYDIGAMDPWRFAELILPRILRFGGRERLRWAFSFYGEPRISAFVRERGARHLDPRSLGFWCAYFGLRLRIPRSRIKGRRWGGG